MKEPVVYSGTFPSHPEYEDAKEDEDMFEQYEEAEEMDEDPEEINPMLEKKVSVPLAVPSYRKLSKEEVFGNYH